MPFHIALVGNPNCGKTTLFNAVTGSAQYVGNWPGVTVEKKEGEFKHNGLEVVMVDLPGVYSLSPYTPEEIVTRKYILESKPDLIINIVDATNLERNLYLTTQLVELGRPMIIAMNMIDMLGSRGISIDVGMLEQKLGIPICGISASKAKGIDELIHRSMHLLHDIAHKEAEASDGIFVGSAERLHNELHNVHAGLNDEPIQYHKIVKSFYEWKISSAVEAIESVIYPKCKLASRFLAVKIFEEDPITVKEIELSGEQRKTIDAILESVPQTATVDRQMMIADNRYKFICGICSDVVQKSQKSDITLSDKIDKVMTNRFLAIPMFLIIMLIIFFVTFGPVGSFFSDNVNIFINQYLSDLIRQGLTGVGAATWAISLVCDGMIVGVGAVLSFLPQIMLLFLFLSILEDSGYMARAAFVMDKPLRKIGLNGRSFVPMLMGFGCTVPAVLATRTLENERDRRLTVMLTPFMSCSAKMPVYAMFISIFFPNNRALIIFSVYILGIILAVVAGFIFKKTILKGNEATFVLELPQYRMPTPNGLIIHIWERLKDFLLKAGTVLLAASVIIWFMQSFTLSLDMTDDSSKSILAALGGLIAPLLVPLGFGSWQAGVALLSGIAAKETIVSTFGILYATADATQSVAISAAFSPLSALSFMTFVLLYIPCFAATATIARELRSVKLTIASIVTQMSAAWIVSFLVYQIGTLLGF
ncbi:MAG: ferrous iron transport protein B [Oscillospiraceae bacterium]